MHVYTAYTVVERDNLRIELCKDGNVIEAFTASEYLPMQEFEHVILDKYYAYCIRNRIPYCYAPEMELYSMRRLGRGLNEMHNTPAKHFIWLEYVRRHGMQYR